MYFKGINVDNVLRQTASKGQFALLLAYRLINPQKC